MLRIYGLIRRYSSLLVIVTFCISIRCAYSSPTQSDLVREVDLSPNRNALEKIYQYKLDRGIKNLSIVSAFLLRSSKKFLHEGKIKQAVELGEYAQLLSPDYPPVYTHLGEVYWAQNRFLIFAVITGWFNSLHATFSNYTFAALLLTNFLLLFLVSFLLTIAVFSIISVYKYFKLLIHDVNHFLPLKLPPASLILWGIFTFSLPLFFHCSIFLIFFFWLMLLFIYHSKRGQHVIIFFAFLLLLSPLFIQIISQFVVTSYSGVFYQLYQANEETWDNETEQKLINWTRHHPDDSDVLFSLGLIKKREGDYGRAKRYYEKVLEIDPHSHRALCNLGNVLLATQKVDSAIKNYTRCLEICPTSVEGNYNLSRAYLLKYMFTESNESFHKAKKLDAERVDYYSRIYSKNINRMVIDETIPLEVFWEKTFEPSQKKKLLSSYLWDRFFQGIPFSSWYSVLFIFLVLVCLGFINHHKCGFSVGCEYCGSAVCRKCRRLVYDDNLCKQCAAVFKDRGDYSISTKGKEKKVMQIERFQKRYIIIGKILSMLLPGAGHLWIDYPLRGSMMLFLFFFLLLKFTYWDGIIINPWLVSNARSYGDIVIVGCVVLILYLYSVLNFTALSERLIKFLSLIKVTRRELQINPTT